MSAGRQFRGLVYKYFARGNQNAASKNVRVGYLDFTESCVNNICRCSINISVDEQTNTTEQNIFAVLAQVTCFFLKVCTLRTKLNIVIKKQAFIPLCENLVVPILLISH